jgi:hypothetical protein
MLGSGLRIGNAATISRDKFVRDGDDLKLELPGLGVELRPGIENA